MKDTTYDMIKNVALIAAPVLVFLSALCSIWNVPHCDEMTATLAAVDTLLGGIVVVAKKIHERAEE